MFQAIAGGLGIVVPALPAGQKSVRKTGYFCYGIDMNSVLEVEQALRQLPPEDRWEVARWLLEDLQEHTASQTPAKSSGEASPTSPELPDYSARRRRIFGDKVLPNMVLAARAQESW